MKLSNAEQASITSLMMRLYGDISAIEEQYKLIIGEGDFRPRIEYFHDAIRALMSQDQAALEKGGRLSVEFLAYDLACLRYLQAMPLSPFKPHGANLSPSVEMVNLDHLLVAEAIRPDRVTKEHLSELYQNYAMLYAALLKPFADSDYLDRTDTLNKDVVEINAIVNHLGDMEAGKDRMNDMIAAIHHIEDPQLRHELLSFLRAQGQKRKDHIKKLAQYLKDRASAKDKQITAIDTAHMNYALSQLAIFEESRDVLRKMASQGMNLVGQFVENSIAQTKRDMGRG